MTPTETTIIALAIADVVEVMQDYRMRRIKHMAAHPECAEDDDAMPAELTREAEAAAIIDLLMN